MYHQIKACRVCGNEALIDVVCLGEQVLTGVFPSTKEQAVTKGPLMLVKCDESQSNNTCGLLQLKHSYALNELYGEHYGYRSGLNQSMVNHLQSKVNQICNQFQPKEDDIIIDIGSNDATTLKAYPKNKYKLIGVDPTAEQFKAFYTDGIIPVFDFFNEKAITSIIGTQKAKIITSFSMFYDLEDPVGFACEISSILSDDGVWVCEQSYMPSMLRQNSFDTICHEHLEYYGLRQIQWIANQADLKILDVTFNDINGGSFSVVLAKKSSTLEANTIKIESLLYNEFLSGLTTMTPYQMFAERIDNIKKQIRYFFDSALKDGKTIYGLGASTKGNVILQYCGLTHEHVKAIGEVNPDKYGCFTPGSLIPIIPESKVMAIQPDYLFVLPWHFRQFFAAKTHLTKTQFVYPLPSLDITPNTGVVT
jgi:NDP-4-keto-2,6-dideoxyhexose 3-C-methyltransferase